MSNILFSAVKKQNSFFISKNKQALDFINGRQKVCSSVYPYIVRKIARHPLKTMEKWQNKFPDVSLNWQSIFHLAFSVTYDTKLQSFQYKFLHNIIYTNAMLYKMKIVASPLCTFCQMTPETASHLFLDCTTVKQFWSNFKSWINLTLNSNIPLSDHEICFGVNPQKPKILVNHLILIAKHFIFRCKIYRECLPTFCDFLFVVQKTEEIEKSIAFQNGCMNKHSKKWRDLSTASIMLTQTLPFFS